MNSWFYSFGQWFINHLLCTRQRVGFLVDEDEKANISFPILRWKYSWGIITTQTHMHKCNLSSKKEKKKTQEKWMNVLGRRRGMSRCWESGQDRHPSLKYLFTYLFNSIGS